MNEPTGNLDSWSEVDVMRHIGERHKVGKMIVFVTHSREIAGVAVEMGDGKVVGA